MIHEPPPIPVTKSHPYKRYIGEPIPRKEDRRFVLGEGRYTDDFSVPGALYAAVVRSTFYSYAQILSIDTTRAFAAPGVIAVLTAADYAADGGRDMPHGPAPADAVDPKRPAFDPDAGATVRDIPQQVLARERAYYLGEPVALVVAETARQARDASELVEVNYEPLDAVIAGADAMKPDAPQLWPQAASNICLEAHFGDELETERAFAHAYLVVEHDFVNQRVSSAHMEPRSTIGQYDAAQDIVTLISGGQGVMRDQGLLAASLGLTRDQVAVISPDVGGSFGTRSHINPEAVLVCWAARRLRRPVRWTADRSESFFTDYQGRDFTVHAAMAFDADGTIRAMRTRAIANIGAYTVNYSCPQNYVRIAPTVYHVPAATMAIYGVLTNTVPTNSYRGAGRPEATFTMERLLEIAAGRLGIDRIDIRRRNLVRQSAFPYTTVSGLTYDSGDFIGNMERLLRECDWEGFKEREKDSERRGRLRGIGLANYVESPIGSVREKVTLQIFPEGLVEIVVGTQSSGQGHETTYAQVVAECLQIPMDSIRIITGDTRRVKVGGGTQSNRSMRLVGTLLVRACSRIMAECRAAVADAGEDGAIDVFLVAASRELNVFEEINERIPAFPTGCAACELEIDPATGATTILRYTQVDDVGQAINPLIVDGQTHGGIAQGVGQALWEFVPVDVEANQVVGSSFMSYALPRAHDFPKMDTFLVEDPTAGNPLRVKGGGEGGTTPAPALVINAVVHALRCFGIEHIEMPATAPRIWAAIHEAKRLVSA